MSFILHFNIFTIKKHLIHLFNMVLPLCNLEQFKMFICSRDIQISNPLVLIILCCAVSSFGIIGLHFFENESDTAVTINSKRYCDMLATFFFLHLKNSIQMKTHFFNKMVQQVILRESQWIC